MEENGVNSFDTWESSITSGTINGGQVKKGNPYEEKENKTMGQVVCYQ